jgi:hypothetical protein
MKPLVTRKTVPHPKENTMSVINKFTVRTLAMVVMTLALMVAAAAVPTAAPVSHATDWAKSLSTSDRQALLRADRLVGLPIEYRKALMSLLTSSDDRTAVWQGVFATYRQQHTLSPEQDAVLQHAEALIPVMFHMPPAERPVREAELTKVSDEVKSLLGPAAQKELFKTAGPDGRTDGLPIAERAMLQVRGWARSNTVAMVAAKIAPSVFARPIGCNCNAGQNDCYYYSHCTGGLNSCSESGGCACDWLFFNCWTCDGQCNYAASPF